MESRLGREGHEGSGHALGQLDDLRRYRRQLQNKSEFLANIKSPDYQPSQAVTEQTNVQVYGNAAVVMGIFRIKGTEKGKPYVHRVRFVDTWIRINVTWQCVATTSI